MRALLLLLSLLLGLVGLHAPAAAGQADIAAASRSVVRVVLVATDGTNYYFVGHGSGFAVSPTKVVTNAHVVQSLREDPSIILGVVPSEGSQSYGARVVAYSPRNDLALLEIEKPGRLTPIALYAGPLSDGQTVHAIGYPGNVDMAQGLDLSELIRPLSPVKTQGTISGNRSAKRFDTILHTAAIGGGNSGGPLVDDCGRVIGVNSFGTVAEGADSSFYFAMSMRELAPFLRQAGVQPQMAGTTCRSIAELNRLESEREAASRRQAEGAAALAAKAREQALEKARRKAELDVIAQRENGMALAGLSLVLALVAFGGAGLLFQREQTRHARIAAILGGLLMLGALVAWFTRPSMADIEDRIKLPPAPAAEAAKSAAAASDPVGDNLCMIDPERSRITVSDTPEVPLNWTEDGCVNGRTQYGMGELGWSRIFVPQGESTVSESSFDPEKREYRVTRYLLDLATMEEVRAVRARYAVERCNPAPDVADKLGAMQDAVRALLPAEPNEVLVYRCTRK